MKVGYLFWTEQKILNGSRIFSMSLELNLFDTLDFYNNKGGNIIEQSMEKTFSLGKVRDPLHISLKCLINLC